MGMTILSLKIVKPKINTHKTTEQSIWSLQEEWQNPCMFNGIFVKRFSVTIKLDKEHKAPEV